MTAKLDLTKQAWTRRRRSLSLMAYGTWIKQGADTQPCIAIIRDGEEYSEHTQPCIIPLDVAWVWSQEVGDGRRSMRQAYQFCQVLRIGDDPRTVMRLTEFIHDMLGDLVSMPPIHPADVIEETVIGELTITDQHGKTREVALTDDV
jgi:hypothetical protein